MTPDNWFWDAESFHFSGPTTSYTPGNNGFQHKKKIGKELWAVIEHLSSPSSKKDIYPHIDLLYTVCLFAAIQSTNHEPNSS